MQHAEGFVDKQTYFSKEHIITVMLEHQGHICFIWYISRDSMDSRAVKEIRKQITEWVKRGLSASLDKGVLAIQREINRFAASFTAGNDKASTVCVYFREHIFVWGEERGTYKNYQKPWGVYMSPVLAEVITTKENSNQWFETWCSVDLAEKARRLKSMLLYLLSTGRSNGGYFLIWEDSNGA